MSSQVSWWTSDFSGAHYSGCESCRAAINLNPYSGVVSGAGVEKECTMRKIESLDPDDPQALLDALGIIGENLEELTVFVTSGALKTAHRESFRKWRASTADAITAVCGQLQKEYGA